MNRPSFLFALLLIGACNDIDNPLDGPAREVVVEAPATPRDLDVLVVVDDSSSMIDKQQRLAANLPGFISGLEALPGGLPNLHLGVVTTDLGTSTSTAAPAAPIGTLGQSGCAGTGKGGQLTVGNATSITGTFLSDVTSLDGTRERNYTGDLAAVFSQMTQVGQGGCGFEQPLAAMKIALDGQTNADFLRPSALLAVLFLTDEDDCSAKDPALFGPSVAGNPLASFRCTRFGVTCDGNGVTTDDMNVANAKTGCHPRTDASALLDDPAEFHDFLVQLKGDPERIILGGIIGTPEPVEVELRTINGTEAPALKHSCSLLVDNLEQFADPGVRLQSVFDSFPHSTTSSICQADFSEPLAQVGDLVTRAVGTLCVGAPLADVLEDPGFQVDCVVQDVLADQVIAEYSPCDAASPSDTCWLMQQDSESCPDFDHLRLAVVRSAAPAPGTIVRARCVTRK